MANIIQINGYTISSSNTGGGGSDFPYTGSAIISGSLIITGSATSTLGFTGSLFGTSSWATNALSSSIASSLRAGTSTITGDSGLLSISTARLSLTGSIVTSIFGNNGVNIIGSITSEGSIRPAGPFTNDVSIYDLGSTSAAWRNVYANNLTTLAGTNTIPPIRLIAGTNLTSPEAGAIEYDGTTLYRTNDTTSGRGYEPSTQIFRLTANGSAIGPAIANFFGANSAIQLAAGGIYEIEANCWFTKVTTGTVTVTITTSAAPVNLNGTLRHGAAGGNGAAQQIALQGITTTAAAFTTAISLNNGTGHAFTIKLLVEANASASNLRFNFTNNVSGTVTPLRGSYYKVTRLPGGNVGNFTA